MSSSEMRRRVTLIRTDFSEEFIAFIIRLTKICELGTLAVTSNHSTLRREDVRSFDISVLKELRGITNQQTVFFIFTARKTSNLM
jgi:hypothetical protein